MYHLFSAAFQFDFVCAIRSYAICQAGMSGDVEVPLGPLLIK